MLQFEAIFQETNQQIDAELSASPQQMTASFYEGGPRKRFPSLSGEQKQALKDLMDEWLAARRNFYYYGTAIMDDYATDSTGCYDSSESKFKLNCSTFVQFIMMGRHVSDIIGQAVTKYTPKVTKAFDFGYMFQFKDRKHIYGLHKTAADGTMDYYGFANPLNDETNWKGTYSRNTYYTSDSKNPKKQTFNPFAYANDMGKELYEMGCEIPFSELEVGDILFSTNDGVVHSGSMFDDVAWRHITHVFLVYNIDSNGELTLAECTADNLTIIKVNAVSNTPSDRTRARSLLHNTVMCARHPYAFGYQPNVPDVLTLSETPGAL